MYRNKTREPEIYNYTDLWQTLKLFIACLCSYFRNPKFMHRFFIYFHEKCSITLSPYEIMHYCHHCHFHTLLPSSFNDCPAVRAVGATKRLCDTAISTVHRKVYLTIGFSHACQEDVSWSQLLSNFCIVCYAVSYDKILISHPIIWCICYHHNSFLFATHNFRSPVLHIAVTTVSSMWEAKSCTVRISHINKSMCI